MILGCEMKKLVSVAVFLLTVTQVFAEIPDHHAHEGTTELRFNYEFLDFENSKQKEDGTRYGVTLDHQNKLHHYQVYYEHSATHTKPVMPKDLSVDKYAFKYQYAMGKGQRLSLTYIQIDDNLIDAVDGGKIYGFGYKYKALSMMQYISDYSDFNVYQTDVKWGMKKKFSDVHVKGALIGKYMYIQDRMTNNFTKKTKQDYFTLGVKIHAEYDDWHVSAVGYVGERIFSVMNEGLRVQHHAMAFQKSAMFALGKKFDDIFINVRYVKQYATEVPMENKDVKVSNIALSVAYTF